MADESTFRAFEKPGRGGATQLTRERLAGLELEDRVGWPERRLPDFAAL
ncbi:hypothetical protein ABIB08_008975 [Bradyrhizobium sp. RT11b]